MRRAENNKTKRDREWNRKKKQQQRKKKGISSATLSESSMTTPSCKDQILFFFSFRIFPLDPIPQFPIHGVVSWCRRDEVGFLHPMQFHSLLVDSTNKSTSQYFWCADHKLAISSNILLDLYRAARRAHSNATLNPSSSPSASAAALIMTHSKALLILCPDLLTAWNSR